MREFKDFDKIDIPDGKTFFEAYIQPQIANIEEFEALTIKDQNLLIHTIASNVLHMKKFYEKHGINKRFL